MKLTQYLRAAYVRAALDDTPTVDYAELIRKTVYDIVVASLPEPVRTFLSGEHGHFLAREFINVGSTSICVPCSRHHCTTLYGQIDLAVAPLKEAMREQDTRHRELCDKLFAVANSCTTTEALARTLPDFAKYIPKPKPKVVMPVAVTGVLEAFKAAGWQREAHHRGHSRRQGQGVGRHRLDRGAHPHREGPQDHPAGRLRRRESGMKIKTTELTGTALDWAVAKATGRLGEWTTDPARPGTSIIDIGADDVGRLMVYRPDKHRDPYEPWSPSTNWSQGGPIIERERIRLDPRESYWRAQSWDDSEVEAKYAPTALIAALRCFVASRLGDEVEIPWELKP